MGETPCTAGPFAQLATVRRGGFDESRHFGSLVALDPDGDVLAELGAPRQVVLPRSSVKPLQALACLRAGAPLAGPSLAIAAGSHTGQDEHVAVVRDILGGAGLTEQDLQCPPDRPEDEETRFRLVRAGVGPERIRMNCSGKHAAMLAACVASGWSTDDYLDPAHPLQRAVADTLSERAGEPIGHVTVDGCGAPLLGISLVGLARAVRSLVVDAVGSQGRAVADAMRAHPLYVGGSGHVNTELMRQMPGVLCKGGAEGVIVAVAARGGAVALKAIDGSPRATTAIVLAALDALGENTSGAAALAKVPVLGGGRPVGSIVPATQVAEAIQAALTVRTLAP